MIRPIYKLHKETVNLCAMRSRALSDADQVLHGRYDKIDLPVVPPVVTRVESLRRSAANDAGPTPSRLPRANAHRIRNRPPTII
jgi:hypothetical protein